MAAPTQRRCDDCSREYISRKANQKICRPCRFLRDLLYWSEGRTRPDNCRLCGDEFKRCSRHGKTCGKCNTGPWRGHCVACLSDNADLIRGEVPVCWGCAMHTAPGARQWVTERLREHIGAAAADAASPRGPVYSTLMKRAEAVSARLGCSVAEAVDRAKAAAGIEGPTHNYAAVLAALEEL